MIDTVIFPEPVQKAIRDRFLYIDSDPFSGTRVYLENAGGGLTLKSVMDAHLPVAALPDNAGRNNSSSREVERAIRDGRRDVALFLNARQGTILSDQSTSSCAFRILEAPASGIEGSNIVCSQLDHASFYDAAAFMAEKYNLERRIVPLNPKTGALDATAVAEQVDEGTIAVTVIHASNITGGKNDMKSIVHQIKSRAPHAIIVADGAQHSQHSLVDVEDTGVDAYIFSAYKVFSNAGFAFAYLSPRLAKLPHTQLQGKPITDWDLGTRDASGFVSFSSVVDYLCWLGGQINPESSKEDRRAQLSDGMRAIENHEAALSQRILYGGGTLPGLLNYKEISLHGPPHPWEGREAVFAFSIVGMPTNEIIKAFVARKIIVHDRVSDAYSAHTLEALGVKEVVRVSLAHYNTIKDVDLFLKTLAEILEINKILK